MREKCTGKATQNLSLLLCYSEVAMYWKGYTKSVPSVVGGKLYLHNMHRGNAIFELRWIFTFLLDVCIVLYFPKTLASTR
jgi:hypothetical protein